LQNYWKQGEIVIPGKRSPAPQSVEGKRDPESSPAEGGIQAILGPAFRRRVLNLFLKFFI
jgi:hypothetical protein